MVKFETSCMKDKVNWKGKGKLTDLSFFNGGKLNLLTNNKLLKPVVVFIPSLSDTVTI